MRRSVMRVVEPLNRDELVSAGTQAARGAALALADEAVRAELLLIGCEAFLSAGDVASGAPLVDDLDRVANDVLAPWATCYRCQYTVYTDPERLLVVDARLQEAIDEFSRRDDPAGLAKAHRVRAGTRARLGRVGDCDADLFEALIAARRSGDHRQITAALSAAPGAALWGPSPLPKAGGRCLDVVRMQRMTTAAPSLEATSLRHLAVLELLRGRPDKARTMLAEARQMVADLGLRHGLMETELFAGIIELMQGDPVAAEPYLRTALDGLSALGVGVDAGQAAALLARSVLAQGRVGEADRYAVESERLAGRNLKTAIAWRAVRAEIVSAQGRHDEAVALARDAVAVAAGTDLVLDHAWACLAFSRVLSAAGDAQGANDARADAEQLYTAKEVVSAIGHAGVPVAAVAAGPSESAPGPSRLAVTNTSCEFLSTIGQAMRAHDVATALALHSQSFVYDDHRRISGDPLTDRNTLRAAFEHVYAQYTQFDGRALAVRGQRLHLAWSCWSDDDGNQTATLHVNEVDDAGRLEYHGRFDEDDFEGAYRELERRYYADEGPAFAEAGAVTTEWTLALSRADFDTLFGELTSLDFCIKNRSRSAFPDRSATEYRATLEELAAMVVSSQSWISAVCWLSPTWVVARCERDAVGENGEHYTWDFCIVFEIRAGRVASMCEFDVDDEAAAFAYAEERVRAAVSRLAVTNRATAAVEAIVRAIAAADVEGAVGCYADEVVYDDHRRLSAGAPVRNTADLRAATKLVLDQFNRFDGRTLAVRGEHLALGRSRWSDDAGNETIQLHVFDVGDTGRIEYEGRFDGDDFETAYRELERRYYAAEGAAFAETGPVTTEWTLALNRADFDTLFGELTSLDFCIKNRSRSAFPDRSATEWRTTLEELAAMVVSAQSWISAVCWLSPTWAVERCERDAVGENGEHYTWDFCVVFEIRDGRIASMCEFDVDDEAAVFAYAEERVRAAADT